MRRSVLNGYGGWHVIVKQSTRAKFIIAAIYTHARTHARSTITATITGDELG